MNIVIFSKEVLDPEKRLDWGALASIPGVQILEEDTRDTQMEWVVDADIICGNHVRFDRELLSKAKHLKYIVMMCTGYNHVDLEYCKERGIQVSNIPTYGTSSVAQFTMALILEACHRLDKNMAFVKEGRWGNGDQRFNWQAPQILLENKTLGIIGYGRIGKAVGNMAKAFGMKILTAGRDTLEQEYVFRNADILSLHCNLTEENEHMICAETIALMKEGVILINTARGKLVDEDAVLDGLRSGKIYCVASDVSEKEPIPRDHPLLQMDSFLLTPHIAWSNERARQNIIDGTAENIEAFLDGDPIHLL
ncbi:MAG: NAD(P)-dependent oxidoreductase [Tissierellia bacterium]|nr:NAD(P)-dependent oxidoreductase [Tissierellia bacterium]